MPKIKSVRARQVLDSRGNPTVEAIISLSDGTSSSAICPSGASTGKLEAMELRDGGKQFEGKGVLKAVKNVHTLISKSLKDVKNKEWEEIIDEFDNKSDYEYDYKRIVKGD